MSNVDFTEDFCVELEEVVYIAHTMANILDFSIPYFINISILSKVLLGYTTSGEGMHGSGPFLMQHHLLCLLSLQNLHSHSHPNKTKRTLVNRTHPSILLGEISGRNVLSCN